MGFFSKKPKVITDGGTIDELLSRSIAQILPSKEELKKQLMSGKRLKFYIGTDATGPQLHLGHSTNYLLMEQFRRLGHEIIILFGDYTALIGDPTDKQAARQQQTPAQVADHIKNWKSQVEKIVSFSDSSNPAKILKNSSWLSTLTFEQLIDISSNFTVQHMLERDMFEKRIETGKPVYLHEFFYPLMQGYDSVAMDVDVEVGGTDQTFNMLAGRILQRRYHNKEKFVIATTLLENPVTGKKLMSKSEGGYIALNDNPTTMFGKTMALADEVIKQVFIDCTTLSRNEIETIIVGHPKEAKMRLAREIVTMYHSKSAAEKAEADWTNTFSEGGVPEEIQEIESLGSIKDTLVKNNIVPSNSELVRLVLAGAVRKIDETHGEIKIVNGDAPTPSGAVFKIGKHRFVKIK